MREAENLAKELMSDIPKEFHDFDRLKMEINNLLHTFLPDDITIKETGILSMVVFEIITNPNRFVRQ